MESRGATLVLDPLAPPPGVRDVWERLDALKPQAVVILKPDHVRDVDLFVRWYGARAYGPNLFWRDDIPHTDLEAIRPGDGFPADSRSTRRPRPDGDAGLPPRRAGLRRR